MSRTKGLVAAVLAAAVAGSVLAGTPASADPLATRAAADALARQLNDTAADATDFAVAVTALDGGSVTVWSASGRLPATASRTASTTSVRVNVRTAPLSRAQITRVESAAVTASASTARYGGAKILGVSVDFTGPTAVLVDHYSMATADAVLRDLGAGYPAGSLVVAEEPADQPYSRLDDTSPYFGGIRIKIAGGGECSSGFGAISKTNHATYLLTAEHCVNNADPRFWDGGDDFLGSATARYGPWDAAAIKTPAGPGMYTGAYNSTTTVAVHDPLTPSSQLGHHICTSGSYSGQLCNGATIQGYEHLGAWCTESGACYPDLILWHADNPITSSPIAGNGDSGGPVYLNPSETSGQVRPVGLVHGYYGHTTACAGQDPTHRLCSSGLTFADVSAIAAKWSLDLDFVF